MQKSAAHTAAVQPRQNVATQNDEMHIQPQLIRLSLQQSVNLVARANVHGKLRIPELDDNCNSTSTGRRRPRIRHDDVHVTSATRDDKPLTVVVISRRSQR